MKKSVLFLVIVLASITVGSAFALTIRLAGDVTIDGTLTTGGIITSPTITSLQSQIDAVAGPVSPDADGDTLQGIDSTGFVQSLQSCPAGGLVIGFNSIGNEICNQISFTRNIRTIIDSGVNSEAHAIAIGSDGFPIIAYEAFPDLKVVHCKNVSCSGGVDVGFDPPVTLVSGNVGFSVKITIGSDDLPVVVHRTNAGAALILTHCGDVDCAENINPNTSTTIDAGPITSRIAVATGSNGFPLIVYGVLNVTVFDMNIIQCLNADCTTRNETLAFDSHTGLDIISIALGTDNNPIITWHEFTGFKFVAVHCNTNLCLSGGPNIVTKTTLDSGTTTTLGQRSSIAIGTDGFPIIAYSGQNDAPLKIIHCKNVTCSGVGGFDPPKSLDIGEANSVSGAARRISMAITNDGNPVILYIDGNDILLKLMQCTSFDCSTFDPPEILDVGGIDGDEINAIVIGNDGKAILVDSINSAVTVIQLGGFVLS